MAREQNFLLGKGELLTKTVVVPTGGGLKNPPYDFLSAKKRISERLEKTTNILSKIPAPACPDGEVVAVLTLHPRYVSKSDFPRDLLRSTGLRAIGTRPKKIKPESWGIKKHPIEAVAEQVFIAGKKINFENWLNEITVWDKTTFAASTITQIEDLKPFIFQEKLRGIPEEKEEAVFEVVLHNSGHKQIVQEFMDYCKMIGAVPISDRARTINGLTFVPIRCKVVKIKDIAVFTFVRVIRGMPLIRPLPSGITRSIENFDVELPAESPLSNDVRAVIFDGGLPLSLNLNKWVNYIEPQGIGIPNPSLVQHGLGVTSAFLFGQLIKGQPLRRPFCPVDHVRVLDAKKSNDMEYLDVLDRILAHLDANKGKYNFINISLGPNFSIEDDDVNQWTSSLDTRFSSDQILATIAAGNSGERDEDLRLNRIQPPADGVNILAVGATDSFSPTWKRATYSSVGPGRSPGYVKPDGVAFGGSSEEPFMVLAASQKPLAVPTAGTSFASPLVLSCAAATRILAGADVPPLAVRALLIHRANAENHGRTEVGWGRLETDPQILMTCEDHEALVIYRGMLPLGQHLRAAIPLPDGNINGKVLLRATLAIAPEVDPENPGTYTKGGLEVAFRPHSMKFSKEKNGKVPMHAKTVPFFSGSQLFGVAEFRLREEGFKWEPCIRQQKSLLGTSLHNPCFDIWFHHREGGNVAKNPQQLPYALVISVIAPKEKDFYNRVVRTYSQILVPLKPKIQIPIRNT